MTPDQPASPKAPRLRVVAVSPVNGHPSRSVVILHRPEDTEQMQPGDVVAIVRTEHRVAEGLVIERTYDGRGFVFELVDATPDFTGIGGLDHIEPIATEREYKPADDVPEREPHHRSETPDEARLQAEADGSGAEPGYVTHDGQTAKYLPGSPEADDFDAVQAREEIASYAGPPVVYDDPDSDVLPPDSESDMPSTDPAPSRR